MQQITQNPDRSQRQSPIANPQMNYRPLVHFSDNRHNHKVLFAADHLPGVVLRPASGNPRSRPCLIHEVNRLVRQLMVWVKAYGKVDCCLKGLTND